MGYLRTITDAVLGRQQPAAQQVIKVVGNRRAYDAAQVDRLTEDWNAFLVSPEASVRNNVKHLRARSQDIERNNVYGVKFGKLVVNNVIGDSGIGLKVKARNPNGTLDLPACKRIQKAWQDWCKRKYCTVSKNMSWRDVQAMALRRTAFDGSHLIRMHVGAKNKYRFALQMIEADYLDHNYNDDLANGDIIRMGVEMDGSTFEPIAYHILKNHPNDAVYLRGRVERNRIPASEIIHILQQNRPNQVMGIPWLHASAKPLRMLEAYIEAELVAARENACKGGYLTSKTDEQYPGETDGDGNIIDKLEPGEVRQLPPGLDFKPHDPTHPNQNMPGFRKAILQGVAGGTGTDYPSIGSDLEGVSYSSIRAGRLDSQDEWLGLQQWFVESMCDPIFEKWLETVLSLTTELAPLPFDKFEKFNAPSWHPRRWDWVDPLKDAQAMVLQIENGLTSRRRVLMSLGYDIEEIDEENAEDRANAEAKGLQYGTKTQVAPVNDAPPAKAKS